MKLKKDIWPTWNLAIDCRGISSSTISGSVTTGTGAGTWPTWNMKTECFLRASLAQTVETWVSWNYNQSVSNTIVNGVITVTGIPDSATQRIRIEAQERQRQREIDNQRIRAEEYKISAEKIIAKEKAEKLLQSALAPEQQEELKSKGFFHCKSNKGNLYRIYRGSHGNVKRVVNGKEIERLCIQPHYVPEGDCMLAQKLHIEFNEDAFRQTANISLN